MSFVPSFPIATPFVASAAVLALAGCTTNVSPSGYAADAEVSTQATGVIVVNGVSGSDATSRSEVVARFVRARSGLVDDDALRMVGASVDFPALGACETLATLRAGVSSSTLALLDVGAVSLQAGEEAALPLQARQLPDVADLVSGVVYSARTPDLPARGRYMVRIDGSPDSQVGAFVVSATSPGEPAALRLAGDDGRSGPVTLSPGPVVMTWDPGSADDVIYVDVGASSAAPSSRCLFADAGRAVIPAAAFGTLEDGTLAVHRLHRETFHARGVEPGEVRFDLAHTVGFARR